MILLAAIFVLANDAPAAVGVASEARAKMNWMLNCQGCHQPDATGSVNGAPAMAGEVARFLSVEGGREYLARVPGVANAGLSDDQLAELLNWTLQNFDGPHVPAGFTPYTAGEIGAARKHPLVSEAPGIRESLRRKFAAGE